MGPYFSDGQDSGNIFTALWQIEFFIVHWLPMGVSSDLLVRSRSGDQIWDKQWGRKMAEFTLPKANTP